MSDRYVYYDGSTLGLHQHFAYSTSWNSPATSWATKTTTVTTYDLLRGGSFMTTYTYSYAYAISQPYEVTNFAPQIPVESEVDYCDWGTTTCNSSNSIRTVNKTWYDQFAMKGQHVVDNGTVTSDEWFAFGPGNEVTDRYECGSGQTCYSSASAPSAYARHTQTQYASFAATPIYTSGPSIFDRPSSVTIYDGSGGMAAQTTYFYDGASLTGTSGYPGHDYSNYSSSYNNRGNATSKTEWLNSGGSSPEWNYNFDDTGQALTITDPNGNLTQYAYSSAYDGAYLTQITYPATTVAHVVSFTYNSATGELASSTDENGQPTSYTYGDPLERLTAISYPDGGNTSYTYYSICGNPASTTTLLNSGSSYQATTTMDGVCNVRETVVADPQGADITDTWYDGLDRVCALSNPYRGTGPAQLSSSCPSTGLTTYGYDSIGRTKSIVYPDQSQATTSYSGICSTFTDPASRTRTLCKDSLGRLEQVSEGGLNATTSYTYNGLDDLLTVSQSGQSRSFSYDSLKRMTSASNPESGTTSYSYDANSNLMSKTDARSITTTYAYDALNRVTSKTYSDGTPTANFGYDETSVALGSWTSPGLNYTKGRLTHTVTTSGGATLTATVQDYDKMGRTQDYWQCTPVNCGTSSIWAANYSYDLAGDVTSWNHPAGFTIYQPVDGARHITQVTSSVSGATYPTTLAFGGGPNSSIEYSAWGAVSQLENGCAGSGCTNIQETYFYNKRMQMAVAELGTSANHAADSCREYSFYEGAGASVCSETPSAWPTGNNNNGNVAGYDYVDNANSTLSHAAVYHYDAVNRLISAAATGSVAYSQTYTYNGDGSNNLFGNLSCAPAGPGCAAFTYSATTNRITNTGYSYDAAGNVIGDGTYTYQWDAESHLTAVYQSGNVVSLNTYNALGQRVEDIAQASTTDEAYGADGELLGRFTGDSNARSFVPFGGGLLAEYFCGGMIFDHPDELGSLTASTDCTGNTVNEKMFYPFGESWTGVALPNLAAHQMFGKLPDYDAEIDQYNTANRHYSPMGRWMSPDPGGVKMVILEDPQTWNMYAYVRNNPTTVTDPTGLGGPQPAATGAAYMEEMDRFLYSDTNAFQAPPPPPEPLPSPNPPGPAEQNTSPALVPLSSDVHYTVANNGPNAPEVHPVFSPETATHLNAAFSELNKDGITPQINSAFRTDSDQAHMQSGGSGTNPAAKVSWHEAGAAVDINRTRSSQFKTIVSVMKKNGFVWGGDFKSKKDPPHFDGRQFMGNLNQAIRKAQGYWDKTN